MNEHVTNMMKQKFIRNKATLKITNNTSKTVTFDRNNRIGILDLRSLGYYKVKQHVLQKHLGKHYHSVLAKDICAQFNIFINLLKKEEESPKEKYPWLDDKDERKYMTDREILDKYINLDSSSLTKAEKKEVRELFYKYKDAFSLRDEIGMCPNIEVEIDVTDKSPFFIRPFHLGQRYEEILLFWYTERRVYCLFKPSLAYQKKIDKREKVVTDFRHLNMCIMKNNLAYPLLKDTLALLGSS